MDSAQENIQLLTSEFIQQCWYFFLFKRSGVIPSRNSDINESEDKKDDGGQIDVTTEKDPLLETETITEEDNSTVQEKGSDFDDLLCSDHILEANQVEATESLTNADLNNFAMARLNDDLSDEISESNEDLFDKIIQPQMIASNCNRTFNHLLDPAHTHIDEPQIEKTCMSNELDADTKDEFVKYASLKTNGYSLNELEDLAVSLAATCLNSGTIDIAAMKEILDLEFE